MKIKINFILFSLIKDGQFSDDPSQLRFSNFFNKPLLVISILLSFYLFLRKKDQLSFQFFINYDTLYSSINIGMLTTKHLVLIFLISKIYLFLIYVRKKSEITFLFDKTTIKKIF